MDVRVITEVSGPGLKDAEEADVSAEESGIECAAGESLRGSAKEGVVELSLVGKGDGVEFFGESKGGEEVGDEEEATLLMLNPVGGGIILALGTVTIVAGVITVPVLVAVGALEELAAEFRGAAAGDIAKRLAMAGKERGGKAVTIVLPEEADDVGQFDRHGQGRKRKEKELQIRHQGMDGVVSGGVGGGGQVSIQRGGGGGVVSQVDLNEAKVDTGFHDMSGVGMA